MESKFETLCTHVYNRIRNKATKNKPITGKLLRDEFNLNPRDLQKILFELRKDYPIVAREAYPYGYYLAKTADDIIEYEELLKNHIKGHKNTLKLMNIHLADFNGIPRI